MDLLGAGDGGSRSLHSLLWHQWSPHSAPKPPSSRMTPGAARHLAEAKATRTLVMGKGRRGRGVPFGLETRKALRTYLRARRRHPSAERPELWLAQMGP